MQVDPRRAANSPEVRAAQKSAELERRISQLERASKGAVLATGIKEQTPAGTGQYLTSSRADISGCSVSITAQVPTIAIVSFTGSASISYTTATQSARIYLNVDGTDVANPYASLEANATAGAPTTALSVNIAQTWRVSLAAGTHTLKLRAQQITAPINGAVSDVALSYILSRA